jgi:hypothetical protein
VSAALPDAAPIAADAGPPADRAALPGYASARLGWIADTDEVSALLEAGGVNDRVAGDRYGAPSVFALAREVRRLAGVPEQDAASGVPQKEAGLIVGALTRAGLFLTPAALAVAAAPWLADQPWYATTGPLVAGWCAAQALVYLGFCAVNEAGPQVAGRWLGLGFGLLAAAWATLLAWTGADLAAWLAGGAQLALFAANAAALVTNRERITLAAAAAGWLATAGLIVRVPVAPLMLLGAALVGMIVVAYRPAVRRSPRPARRWRPHAPAVRAAAWHGLAGAGQAALFLLVVLGFGVARSGFVSPGWTVSLWTAAPLLAAIPLTELLLAWHWRRAGRGRARLAGQRPFLRHLAWGGVAAAVALVLPLGGGLALAVGRQWTLAAATLLAGVQATCLVIAAHRRPGLAAATGWCLATLVIAAGLLRDGLAPQLPPATAGVLVLVCGYPLALVPAVSAMIDPWSHR